MNGAAERGATRLVGRVPAGESLSGRGFWVAFGLGWIAVGGLLISGTLVEMGFAKETLALVVMTLLPPMGASVPLAVARERLLRPEWTLTKLLGVHALVGLAYAVFSAAIGWVLGAAFAGPLASLLAQATPRMWFFYRVVQALFLYVMLVGYLMWTVSVVRVHESRSVLAREAMLRSKAELEALRSRFNPHFVFNTLHSLMLLVRQEPDTAERAIEDVAELIRYATVLQRSGADRVPLAKEVEVSRRYVALEKLRLEERLRVTWSVADDLGDLVVPAFTLQLLLENAINHGVAPSDDGGEVRVVVQRRDGRVWLAVEDDGCGAEQAAVGAATGRGIDLLAKRLSALYGSDAGLDFETSPGTGFRVSVVLPAMTVDEARVLSREGERLAEDLVGRETAPASAVPR